MCFNPAKGRVEFEESWLIKSSFTTKDEMKACQLTKLKKKCFNKLNNMFYKPYLQQFFLKNLKQSFNVLNNNFFKSLEKNYANAQKANLSLLQKLTNVQNWRWWWGWVIKLVLITSSTYNEYSESLKIIIPVLIK